MVQWNYKKNYAYNSEGKHNLDIQKSVGIIPLLYYKHICKDHSVVDEITWACFLIQKSMIEINGLINLDDMNSQLEADISYMGTIRKTYVSFQDEFK